MPTFKVYATHQPDEELEVEETELIDLARQGLLVLGKGDISKDGRIRRRKDAAPEDAPSEDAVAAIENLPATDSTQTGA